MRAGIWDLYAKVKEAACSQTGQEEVERLYDQLVGMHSISPGVNEVIASFAQYREEIFSLNFLMAERSDAIAF